MIGRRATGRVRADNPEFRQGDSSTHHHERHVMLSVEGEVVHVEAINGATDLAIWIADGDGVVHRCALGTVRVLPAKKK